MFFNIPNIDAFINRRTARYVGKIARSNDKALLKKFLTAWINKPRKNGAPQLTCNSNFARAISDILPLERTLSNNSGLLKEWLPLAKDEKNWLFYIDEYFESCRRPEESDDESEEDEDEHTSNRVD
jgi:hypothetical protein